MFNSSLRSVQSCSIVLNSIDCSIRVCNSVQDRLLRSVQSYPIVFNRVEYCSIVLTLPESARAFSWTHFSNTVAASFGICSFTTCHQQNDKKKSNAIFEHRHVSTPICPSDRREQQSQSIPIPVHVVRHPGKIAVVRSTCKHQHGSHRARQAVGSWPRSTWQYLPGIW